MPQDVGEPEARRGPSRVSPVRGQALRTRIAGHLESRTRLKEAAKIAQVLSLLEEARSHGKARNSLLHRFYGQSDDGAWVSSGGDSKWDALPSADDVTKLTIEIDLTADRLNAERFDDGFILRVAD